MNPCRIFIERPVATTLLMAAVMLLGIVAYSYLPLSALPTIRRSRCRRFTRAPALK